MAILRTFVLRSADDWRALAELVRELGPTQASKGAPLLVHVAVKRAQRRLDQNARMWADVLEQIAAQAVSNGRRYSAESWHEEMKKRHLPDMAASGVEKWRYAADGGRDLAMSTGDLNDEEFDQYLMAIQADAADRHGVTFYSREEQPV